MVRIVNRATRLSKRKHRGARLCRKPTNSCPDSGASDVVLNQGNAETPHRVHLPISWAMNNEDCLSLQPSRSISPQNDNHLTLSMKVEQPGNVSDSQPSPTVDCKTRHFFSFTTVETTVVHIAIVYSVSCELLALSMSLPSIRSSWELRLT